MNIVTESEFKEFIKVHETDYTVTSSDLERAMIIDYLRAEADKLKAEDQNKEAYVILSLIQDIQLGVHTQLPK